MQTRSRAAQQHNTDNHLLAMFGRDVLMLIYSYLLPSFEIEQYLGRLVEDIELMQKSSKKERQRFRKGYPDFLRPKVDRFLSYERYAVIFPHLDPMRIVASEMEAGMKILMSFEQQTEWHVQKSRLGISHADPMTFLLAAFLDHANQQQQGRNRQVWVWMAHIFHPLIFRCLWALLCEATILSPARHLNRLPCRFCEEFYNVPRVPEKYKRALFELREECRLIRMA